MFLLSACKSGSDDNIENINNGILSLSIKLDVVIGEEDQPPEYLLGEPVGVRTDHEGNIYIADRASLTVKVFDNDGTYLHSFGGRGRGPGEFQNINLMEKTPEGNLFILDRGKLEYIYLSKQGNYLSSHRVDVSNQTTQYYPHRVFWYEDKTIGIRRSGAIPSLGLPPFERPLFHIYSNDFQQHFESFFPFYELGYSEYEHFIWNSFGWLPGSFDLSDNGIKLVYSPGVYNGVLYEFIRTGNSWVLNRKINAVKPSTEAYEIYTSNEQYERNSHLPGVNKIHYFGGPYIGRLYSVDAGIFYLENGNIAHFYGEWRGGDKTLEKGNTLDIIAQILDCEGEVKAQGHIISIERDARPSLPLINWKDDEGKFYLIDSNKYGVPKVKKFKLVENK